MHAGPDDDAGVADTTPGPPLDASVHPLLAAAETHSDVRDSPTLLDRTPASDSGDRSSGSSRSNQRIGRFFVLRELGRGAMGVVLVAYDELLDRKVALKLLHVHDDGNLAGSRNLLLREAQALARLTHPNVVAVHECGVFGGEVYLAMEYVQGSDLKAWLAAAPRTWQQIAAVFHQAGTGLLAAHRQGLVHRDFKPTNVLVGDDGRVRVADFGLAAQRSHLPDSRREGMSPAVSVLDGTIAGLGSLVGTPSYMAPELFRHEPATPRSDQFAFCVALWECLYGARPFAGKNSNELAALVETQDLPTAPLRPDVPHRLHALLLRGLHRDPADRFPSMVELLAALEPRPPRSRLFYILPGLVALAAAAFPFLAPQTCPDAQEVREQVWTDAQGLTIAHAFARAGLTRTGAVVVDRLAEYGAAWAADAADACDERDRLAADPRLLDARHQCLERARTRFVALRADLEAADTAVARNAQIQIDALPDLGDCSILAVADLECNPVPIDPVVRRDGARGWALLDEAARLELAGNYRDAITKVRAALEVFEDLPHASARLHARTWLGRLLQDTDDPIAARPVLLAARDDAERMHCDDTLVEIYDRLLNLAAYNPAIDLGEARGWLTLQDLRAQTTGRAADAALVWHNRGLLALYRDNDLEAAARALQEARTRHEAAGQTASRRLADTLRLLGLVELSKDELDAAVDYFNRSRDTWAAATSPEDPLLWKPEYNLGLVANHRGDWAAAREHLRRARAFAASGLDPRGLPVAKCLIMLGIVAEHDHDLPEALQAASEALAIISARLPRDDPRRIEYLEAYAEILTSSGQPRAAIDHLREILVLMGDAPPSELAWPHLALARAFNDLDDPGTALPHAEFAAHHGEESSRGRGDLLASADYQFGRALLELGRPLEARPPLERSVQRWSRRGEDAENLVDARFALARALCAAGETSGRPLQLAEAALTDLGRGGSDHSRRAHALEIKEWISRTDCSTVAPRTSP